MTVVATFPLLAEPPPPDAVGGGGGVAGLAPIEDRSLLGYGLLAPLRRDRRLDFASAGGVQLVRSAISQILGTRADDGRMTGELPWRPEMGSLLHRLQYAAIDDSFASLVRSRVIGAISLWEPRARITSVQVVRAADAQGHLQALIRVAFDIVQSGTQNVLVRNQQLDVPLPT